MKLAFTTLGCPEWNIEQIAEFAEAHGFDGVELRTHDDGNHFSPDSSVEDAAKVRELFESKGTRVFSLMAYTNFGSTDAAELAANREKLLKILDLAKAIGAGFVRTFAGRFGEAKTKQQAISEAAEYLAPCAAKAREIGVQLGVETHDDWCDAANIKALQAAVGEGLGCIWDFANAVRRTSMSIPEQYRELEGTIIYCHVKDTVTLDDGKTGYVPVGTGDMPVSEVVETLKADGQDLFLSFEHEKKWHPELPDPEEAFPAYIEYMRSLI